MFWSLVFGVWPLWLILIGYLIFGRKRPVSSANPYVPYVSHQNENDIRRKVAAEIRAQVVKYKSKSQQQVVEEMASTVEYFASNPYTVPATEGAAWQLDVTVAESAISPQPALYLHDASPVVHTNIDSATTLLYLGAFLLLASIGLYVGVGSGDMLKPWLVAIITGLFYIGGLRMYTQSKRLKPAGQTFAGIGMATLPMAGAAVYYYGFHQEHGPAVWLTVSLVAVAMYVHAMRALHTTLVAYMLVFSTLSVVLSGISTLGLAPFYFIHGLGIFGLICAVVARMYGKGSTLVADSYGRSAMFLVPLSIVMSVLSLSTIGWGQVALSLALGAMYYGYEYIYGVRQEQIYSLLGQVGAIGSALCALYAVAQTAVAPAVLAGLFALLYSGLWMYKTSTLPIDNIQRQYAKVILLGLPLLALGLMALHISHAWIALVLLALVAAVVYSTDREMVSGMLLVLPLVLLPVFVMILGRSMPASAQVLGYVYLGLAFVTAGLKYSVRRVYTEVDRVLMLFLAILPFSVSIVTTLPLDMRTKAMVASIHLVLFLLLAIGEKLRSQWLGAAATVQLFWLLAFVSSGKWLFAMTVVVVLTNIVMLLPRGASLMHRWLVVCGVLVLPLQYGMSVRTLPLQAADYQAIYFVIAFALVAGRYVLRARLQDRRALEPIWFGYIVALGAAIFLAIFAGGLSAAIWLFVSGMLLVAVSYIESSAATIVPAFVCGYLSILYLVGSGANSTTAKVVIVVAVSQAVYWVLSMSGLVTMRARYARYTVLAVSAAVPVYGLSRFEHSLYPISLAAFGVILAREVWDRGRIAREFAMFVLHASAMWLLYTYGVRQGQVFTHATAAFVGLLGYLRYKAGEPKSVVDQYVWAAVLIGSVPLVLQALAGSGSGYSYLALIEHVLLIVAALNYRHKSLVWYGLVVVIGSVMFQLRTYKYAALAVLGTFVIGIAIYYLNKTAPPEK
jgi:hypothetical protein